MVAKTATEAFHKELDRGEAGDNMGALLRGIKREQLKRGQVIIAPGSMKAVKKFQAQIYVRFAPLCMVFGDLVLTTLCFLGPYEGRGWPLHSFHGKLHATAVHPYGGYQHPVVMA